MLTHANLVGNTLQCVYPKELECIRPATGIFLTITIYTLFPSSRLSVHVFVDVYMCVLQFSVSTLLAPDAPSAWYYVRQSQATYVSLI